MQHQALADMLINLGKRIVGQVHHALTNQSVNHLTQIYKTGQDDIIYQIDKDVEAFILPELNHFAPELGGVALVAEGMAGAEQPLCFPENINQEQAAIRLIIDPIDGTRGIMYNKRSAFFLAGVALNKGPETALSDVEVAVMVEIPTARSYLSDVIWAIKGTGVFGQTWNLLEDTLKESRIHPSQASSVYGGFAQISRFFPPGKDLLAKIEEELVHTLFPDFPDQQAFLFEDQYISSGGQFYELLMGHDRFTADIRGALYRQFRRQGKKTGHVCHPYDVCTSLILEESGVILTGLDGKPLNYCLDTHSAVDWVGYANQNIRQEVEPVFQKLLHKYQLVGI
ncbi:MAG: inositol monophosphatase family protein [Candidatus Cyclobacteriaceae bacterium M3_2C_046]